MAKAEKHSAMCRRMHDKKLKKKFTNERATRNGLREIIEGKSSREQRQQRSSHGVPQSSSSSTSSLSFNNSNNVAGDFSTQAITSRNEGTVKRRVGSRIIAKKLQKSKLKKMKKAKKILKKMTLEVAETRGEINYMKELQMEETAAMEATITEMESKLARQNVKNQIEFVKNIHIQQFVDFMLHVFEAEDYLS